MCLDIHSETIRTLPKLARIVPKGDGQRGVNACTVHRWAMRGVRGIRLETVLIGGIRYSSDQALQRFIERTTAAANGETVPVHTNKQREKAHAAAERELAEAGI